MSGRRPNVLQSAAVLVLLMLCLAGLVAVLAGCASAQADAPTRFEAGRPIGTPAGCVEARRRGHDC